MDSEQFREKLNQRYIAEKILDGASAREIADGFGDPVAEIETICGGNADSATSNRAFSPSRRDESARAGAGFLLICLLLLFALACVLWFV